MAVSRVTKIAAIMKRKILKTVIKSPTVKLDFLLTEIANTSVPSITAPPLIENPIPLPKKNPPKTAIKSLSAVMVGTSM